MITRSKTHLLFPLLAMGLTLALSSTVQAQTPPSVQISFGSTPHWTTVEHTNVMILSEQDRPTYDVFRYGNEYYVYRDNRWYQSRQSHGTFYYVDQIYVPREFSQVPSKHWRAYPAAWVQKNKDPHYSQYGKTHNNGKSESAHDKEKSNNGHNK